MSFVINDPVPVNRMKDVVGRFTQIFLQNSKGVISGQNDGIRCYLFKIDIFFRISVIDKSIVTGNILDLVSPLLK